MDPQWIRQNLEDKHLWREAEDAWRRIGRIFDADSCKMIADGIDLGNLYRDTIKLRIGAMPSLELAPDAYYEWHKKLGIIYNEFYKQ